MDDVSTLIESLATAAWPALVFYVVLTYRKPVAAIIDSARGRKFTIEVGGQKLSMDEANQQQQTLIADLQTQLLALRAKVEGFQVSPKVALADTPTAVPQASTILWVDDNPKNNSYFIELLQKRGYRVDLAVSTAEGLKRASENSYRVILSDMGRSEDDKFNEDAGVDLLEALQKRDSKVPYVIFCSTEGAKYYRTRVKTLGARAITASPMELRAVLDELAPEIRA
jgi:CheY-like chemotaxis protein